MNPLSSPIQMMVMAFDVMDAATDLWGLFIAPFAEFAFMRRALVASLALSVGGSAIGVFLILRRMSLMGDALAHSLLPGAAMGFLIGGLSLPAMSLGGFIAGVATALLSGVIARFSSMREDASFAAAYLTAMALGVLLTAVMLVMVLLPRKLLVLVMVCSTVIIGWLMMFCACRVMSPLAAVMLPDSKA